MGIREFSAYTDQRSQGVVDALLGVAKPAD
jgi:hypothetical protein